MLDSDDGNPPTSMEWSVNLDRLERFAVAPEQIRRVASGFQVSVGQAGRDGHPEIRTAVIRRGSRSRMFWTDKNRTACVVLERPDILQLSQGLALVFKADRVVIMRSKDHE